jgi:dethiobiotin synthetase
VILIVTGTGTDVGKTVATAALAVCAEEAGHRVTVVKPVQTGEPPGHGDLRTVTALTGITDTHCFVTCPEPLAPVAAARRAGVELPGLDDTVHALRDLDGPGRVVLVEGAGGVLVSLGDHTLADLAVGLGAPVVVVTTTFLGSLNHCALTLEALERRGVRCLGTVGGSVPAVPADPADTDVPTATTLEELETGPWLGGIPAGAGALDTEAFRAGAPRWLDLPEL